MIITACIAFVYISASLWRATAASVAKCWKVSQRQESVQILCSNCLSSTFSRVEKETRLSDENTWAMFCGCFGSCYGIYSVLSGDNYYGLAKYTHYCVSCGTIIGTYQPKPTTKMKCIIVLLICVIV